MSSGATPFAASSIFAGAGPGESWYDAEVAVAARLGVVRHDLFLSSDRQPPRPAVVELIRLLETAPRPALLHCDAGADRAGFASAIARIVVGQAAVSDARRELSFAFGHMPFGPSYALDRVFDGYERHLEQTGIPHASSTFTHWAATAYVPYGYNGAIETLQFPARSEAGVGFEARFRVRNLSAETWRPWRSHDPGVRLGFRLRRDGDDEWTEYPHRFDLDGPVAPQQTAEMTGFIATPTVPGPYTVKVDLVDEGVTWFEPQGSTPITIPLVVLPVR